MRKKILIVDDNSDLLDVLQQGLKQYDLILAENGKQAVEIAYTLHPDLILMDLMMPEMDGHQAIGLIHQNLKTHAIPIWAISADFITNIKEECSRIGCDDFIAKPFTFTQLGFRTEKLLKQHRN